MEGGREGGRKGGREGGEWTHREQQLDSGS